MSLSELKEEVYKANIRLYQSGLVISTFGNASGIDRANPYTDNKIKLQLVPLAETGYMVPKAALFL